MPFSDTTISLASLDIYNGFEKAAAAVLEFLSQRIDMGVWMVTRTQQDDQWVVLQAEDKGYGLKGGRVLKWSDSFCSRMVKGEGPRIAPDSTKVPVYVEAAKRLQLPIKSYIGIPMLAADGSLFGTICAVSPEKKPPALEKEQPLLELLSRLLATILAREMGETAARRDAERAKAEANRDELTGLYNRRGLTELLDREEDRCRRYGNDAGVLSIDVNGLKRINDEQGHSAGDETIRNVAAALKRATRRSDIVARIGGDEFVIIAMESGSAHTAELSQRVREQLKTAGVSAAVGSAQRLAHAGMKPAMEAADAAMYQDKRKRQTAPRRLTA